MACSPLRTTRRTKCPSCWRRRKGSWSASHQAPTSPPPRRSRRSSGPVRTWSRCSATRASATLVLRNTLTFKPPMPFIADSEEQVTRYSRHILLPEVGGKGQQKIGQAKVLIVGAGGLGSPAAFYLAAAGVGTIGLIDSDAVDLSNLQRQIIHQTPDIGRPKAASAKAKILALNPSVGVETYNTRSEEHTSELQSRLHLVCRLLLE